MPASPDAVFRALGDPTRRALFQRLLSAGEQTVQGLTDRARVSQPMVSKHLRVLKDAGLVRHRYQGRETYYRARPQGLTPLVDWINRYRAFWPEHLDRLENLLKRMAQ